jgi:hypothetical protein
VIVESKLALAARHVARGKQIVVQQRALIAKRREAGQDTTLAEGILVQFENSLAIFEADLLAIKKEGGSK